MAIKNRKKTITVLLIFSCIISGIILAATPSQKNYKLSTHRELDSLIQGEFRDSGILQSQIRTYMINTDSTLTRKIFRVNVPTRFSKTLFHVDLQDALYKYNMKTPARITLPRRDMDIYMYYKGTVLRTIRLNTDPGLDTLAVGGSSNE